jgi:hypothetical protein
MWGWDLALTERRNNNNNNNSTASKGVDEPWVGIMKNE